MINNIRRFITVALLCFASAALFSQENWYWDLPAQFSGNAASFPLSSHGAGLSALAWQESVSSGDDIDVSIVLSVQGENEEWISRGVVAGPYRYKGAEPSIASLLVDSLGRIFLAVGADASSIDIFRSDDQGLNFTQTRLSNSQTSNVAPRIFQGANGSYLLFSTQGVDESLSLFLARSADGSLWSDFESFVPEAELRLNFLPSHAALPGRDFVLFQSLTAAEQPTFQLYLKLSEDGGESWSKAYLLTDFINQDEGRRDYADFDNQRAHLSALEDALLLVWERKAINAASRIFAVFLNENGEKAGGAEQVNDALAVCGNPIGFSYRGEAAIVWFDNRRGQNRIMLARKSALGWDNADLSGANGEAFFARPLIDNSGLQVFWQRGDGERRIYRIGPDVSARPPVVAAVNFMEGRPVAQNNATLTWHNYDDPSGIAGYAYLWSPDPDESPPEKIALKASETRIDLEAEEDGPWYFSLKVADRAGNWSPSTRVEFVRDTTPPGRVHIIPPEMDDYGYIANNDFAFVWNPPPASDIQGFSWDLSYLGVLNQYDILARFSLNKAEPFDFQTAATESFPALKPSPRSMGTTTEIAFENKDNGLWRFQVAAIDIAGNIGQAAAYYFRANKFRPYTYIAYIDAKEGAGGIMELRIVGRGFLAEGRVDTLFLDKDGLEPYDYSWDINSGAFRVESDRTIVGLRLDDIDAGGYRFGLSHPHRGLYFAETILRVDESGTVKFGDYSKQWKPAPRVVDRRFAIDTALLIAAAALLFGLIAVFVFFRGFSSVVREGAAIRTQVQALITGDYMPSQKKERLAALRKRSSGLRLKLTFFAIFLVMMIVVLVSVPLSILMTNTQESTLLNGLRDRSRVLLESLASGARAYLPSKNTLELGILPSQTDAVPEALYATITGYGMENTIYSDYVWATNDPDIPQKIHSDELSPGLYRLEDELSPILESTARELDERARREVGDLALGISELNQEGLKLLSATDEAELKIRDDIQSASRELESRLTERLAEIAGDIGSYPDFPDRIADARASVFILYKPVMFRQGAENTYYRGAIRLAVSIDSIVEAVAAGREELIRITLIVALAALAIGILGAFVLASIIIRPIKRLAEHVEMIRDTENKADLAGKELSVKGRDEIAVLGTTINDMTEGLVKAAMASRDLTIGKEVQKMFIPLETDKRGKKLTTGKRETDAVDFFGYYEGAKGVSGDYFDYLQLDDRYFAIIKCDVAGKGVPAALIMVEVATLFLNFFKHWKPNPEGFHLERLVYQINDFIEERGFKGRFAAFTLCLYDSKTGLARFCNAGDKYLHWYSAEERKMKTLSLNETPTAGVFPNSMIEAKGGYTVQSVNLKSGDIMFFYTDGIEEAKRRFRDSSFKEQMCEEKGIGTPPVHGNHTVGQADEEFGVDRVEAIINAVFERSRYDLRKYHNPENTILSFDFSSCSGTVEDAIMALVAIEKVFRFYKLPSAGPDDRVLVDKKVDAFLKEHFDQYRVYCLESMDHPEYDEYMYYTFLKEDEQYDDLTLLGLRKK